MLLTLLRLLTDAEEPARGRVACENGCNMLVEGEPGLPLLLLPLPERFFEGGEIRRGSCASPIEADGGGGPGGGRIPPTGVLGLDRELAPEILTACGDGTEDVSPSGWTPASNDVATKGGL